jgi:hypothetical protein
MRIDLDHPKRQLQMKNSKAGLAPDDEDVRKINPFLIDPAGTAHHVVCRWASWARMTQQTSKAYNNLGQAILAE